MKDLSNATGISTSDIRAILIIDDWKDTMTKVVKAGSSIFKEIIPYGS